MTAFPDWSVQRVKEALFAGGFAQSASDGGIRSWSDIDLIYAGMVMDNGETMSHYHVPPVRRSSTNGSNSSAFITGLPVPHRRGQCTPPQPHPTPGLCILELIKGASTQTPQAQAGSATAPSAPPSPPAMNLVSTVQYNHQVVKKHLKMLLVVQAHQVLARGARPVGPRQQLPPQHSSTAFLEPILRPRH